MAGEFQQSIGIPCAPKRNPIAVEILGQAERLAERAHNVAGRTSDKLISVMLSGDVLNKQCGISGQPEEYPPLFAGLRNYLQEIDAALDRIDSAISRTEL